MKSRFCTFLISAALLLSAPIYAKAEETAQVNQLLGQKQFSKAFDLANQNLKEKPDGAAYLGRGNAYWSICDYRNAISDYDKALVMDSSSIDALVHKGICLARLGNKDESLKTFEQAANLTTRLDLNQCDPHQIETTGKALIEGGRLEALQKMIDALKASNNNIQIAELATKLDAGTHTPASESVTKKDQITAGMTSFVATPHFVFIGDIDKAKLERYGAIAEGFLDYLQRKGLGDTEFSLSGGAESNTFKKLVDAPEPVSIFILHDKMAVRAFLKERLNFPYHVHGVFISSRNLLVTYDGAGPGTYLHEVMHTVLSRQKNLEYWAEEGIPSYFEKVYGAISPQFELRHGYGENWFPQALSVKAIRNVSLNLADIVGKAKHADASQEVQQRLVALFLQKYNHLDDYLTLTVSNQNKGYKTFVEAAFDKPMVKLVPMFNEFIHEIRHPAHALDLPPSQIFDTKFQLHVFEREHLGRSGDNLEDFLKGKSPRYNGYNKF
jgi:tetratricopeptide (TPR) repeat protein